MGYEGNWSVVNITMHVSQAYTTYKEGLNKIIIMEIKNITMTAWWCPALNNYGRLSQPQQAFFLLVCRT